MIISDLKKLEYALSEIPGEEVYNLEQVHGMLTAILTGPSVVMPSDWVPYVFSSEGKMPNLEHEKTENLISLLMKLNNHIASQLDSRDFVPLIGCEEEGGKPYPDPHPWCLSFLEGMSLWGEEWVEGEDDDSVLIDLLTPIVYFADIKDKRELRTKKSKKDIEKIELDLIEDIPRCVWNIREYWRKRVCGEDPEMDNEEYEVLEFSKEDFFANGLCLCGSGKQFDRCCWKNSHN
ncbi:YecA family protein [Chitinispirillales bacterium ANBcel5]|uniref:UPF0149 family protein n=1 Tax=Cellulosispirillum alkaliphilum TaxID=3039283 RepID=UPI002A574375|nr:YecA family protein [Chitinispirillales bacterium ANBcel5]